jgi:P27 family predicted phage terminase small subunit
LPACPEGLSGKSAALWEEYWRSDVSRAVEITDHYALRRWIEAVDERDRLAEAVREEQTVTGSMGQPVLNPLTKRLEFLEGSIERFERQFGMTPKARADLGISLASEAMTAERLNQMAAGKRDAKPKTDDQETIDGEAEEVEGFIDAREAD